MYDFPWPIALASWLFALALGVWLGRLSEIHKETVVTYLETVRGWFDRWALALYSVIAIMALIGIVLGGSASIQNGKDLVTSCQNANESRAASRALWGYIIDLSTASHPHPSKHEADIIVGFRDYVNTVYAPHDCTDLSKKYPLPSPPAVIAPTHPHGRHR